MFINSKLTVYYQNENWNFDCIESENKTLRIAIL